MRWTLLLALVITSGCQDNDVDRSVGARCDMSSECDERCLGPSGKFPDGFCTVSCDNSNDCNASDLACVDSDGGACLFRCVSDGDCTFVGPGWKCKAFSERGNGDVQVSVCAGT